MAISSEYVHSNIHGVTDTAGPEDLQQQLITNNQIDESIATLEEICRQLKAEAEDFLQGTPFSTMNAELLSLGNTYSAIANDVINDPQLIKSLVVSEATINATAVKELTKKLPDTIREQILAEVHSEQIGVAALSKIIGRAFGDAEGVLTDTGVKFSRFLEGATNAGMLEDEAVELLMQNNFHSLQSVKGKIVDYTKEALLKTNQAVAPAEGASVTQYMEALRKALENRQSEIKFYYDDFTLDDYLKAVEGELRSMISKNIIDARNASGITGEQVRAAIFKADKAHIFEIDVVGNQSEEQLLKTYKNQFSKMQTPHADKKMSTTDLIITNQAGKKVRAQAKQSMNEREITIGDDQKAKTILNHIVRATQVADLLKSLNSINNGMHIGNIDTILFTMANALWFRTHNSISGKRKHGYFTESPGKLSTNIFTATQNAIGAMLNTQAATLLGVSFQKAADEVLVETTGSNIFYIENGRIIPTYIQIERVIEDLRRYQTNLNKMKTFEFTLQTNHINWVYPNAKAFFIEKVQSHSNAPGQEQYDAAISSITVTGNFKSLLSFSSYR